MVDQIRTGQVSGLGDRLVVKTPTAPTGPDFAEVLAQQLGADGIKLSAHAHKRLHDVPVSSGAAERLSGAFQRAEQKGSRESLILVDDLAFVVSVKNKTVITAVENGRAKENVFTNIDSVVIG